MTRSMAGSRAYRSATQGRATTAMCACGNTWRMARIAGSDMTASPSQLVARTNTFDMEDGLKATGFRIPARLKARCQAQLWANTTVSEARRRKAEMNLGSAGLTACATTLDSLRHST